jgi:large subunit ribosomal protein L6
MSRIGKQPVDLPKGVEARLDDGTLTVKGPRGSLELRVHPEMKVSIDDGVLTVERPSDAVQAPRPFTASPAPSSPTWSTG